MKKKMLLALVLVMLVFAVMPVGAWALGPYPPTLTVIVYGAPKDLQMNVLLQYEGQTLNVPMDFERRAWESYYRVYRDYVSMHTYWHGNGRDFKDAELVLVSGEGEKVIPIPDGLLQPRGYDEILTVRYATGELSYGFPAWRAPLLIGLRVLAALLVEGIFFRFYGYTTRRSWLMFVIINVVVHGIVNSLCYGRINITDNVYRVAYFTIILLSFLAELCAFLLTVVEYDSDRLSKCLIKANVASHAVNYLLIKLLPL